MRRIFSAFCAENAAGTAAYLIKEFNQIIVLDIPINAQIDTIKAGTIWARIPRKRLLPCYF